MRKFMLSLSFVLLSLVMLTSLTACNGNLDTAFVESTRDTHNSYAPYLAKEVRQNPTDQQDVHNLFEADDIKITQAEQSLGLPTTEPSTAP